MCSILAVGEKGPGADVVQIFAGIHRAVRAAKRAQRIDEIFESVLTSFMTIRAHWRPRRRRRSRDIVAAAIRKVYGVIVRSGVWVICRRTRTRQCSRKIADQVRDVEL